MAVARRAGGALKPAIVRTNASFGRGRCGDSPDYRRLLGPHDRGDDVAARGSLVRVALAAAHVVRRPAGDGCHQHADQGLYDVLGVVVVEERAVIYPCLVIS